MKNLKLKWILILTLFIIHGCSSSDSISPTLSDDTMIDPGTGEYNILFIGNSLTYTYNIPDLLTEAAASEDISITTTSVTPGGYGLEDHWNQGAIQPLIESRAYDYVVIQQGPSSQPPGRASLIEYGGRIAALCQAHGVKLVYYMVWPSLNNYHTFDGVIANYTEAAALSGSLLAPVGAQWKAHFDATADFSYYGPDGFHPSLEGSTVAAEVIFETLQL